MPWRNMGSPFVLRAYHLLGGTSSAIRYGDISPSALIFVFVQLAGNSRTIGPVARSGGFAHLPVRVQLLQRVHVDFSPLQCGNAFGGCAGCR
jgi:hypothetical protein